MASLDLFAHTNPAHIAVIVHWVATGFSEVRESLGLLDKKFMPLTLLSASLPLLATDGIRQELPKRSSKYLCNVFLEHPEWRAYLATTIDSWFPTLWKGVGYGCAAGVLVYSRAAVAPTGKIKVPSDPWAKDLRSRSLTFGKVVGKEKEASAIRMMIF